MTPQLPMSIKLLYSVVLVGPSSVSAAGMCWGRLLRFWRLEFGYDFFWLFLQMNVIEKWRFLLLPCPYILVSYLEAGVKGQGGDCWWSENCW